MSESSIRAGSLPEVRRVEIKLPEDKYDLLKSAAKQLGVRNVGPLVLGITLAWIDEQCGKEGGNVEISAEDAVALDRDRRKRGQTIASCLKAIDPEGYDEDPKSVLLTRGAYFHKLGNLFVQAGGCSLPPFNLSDVKAEFVRLVEHEALTDPPLHSRLPSFILYMVTMNEQHRQDSRITAFKVKVSPPTVVPPNQNQSPPSPVPVEEKPSVVDQFVQEMEEPKPPPAQKLVYVLPSQEAPAQPKKKQRDKTEREAFAETADWDDWQG